MWRKLICVFLLTVGTGWAAEPVNLITNGGFEEGAAGWEPDPKQEMVTTPGVAHSGKACLTGEVTAEKQALSLRRRVPVRPGYRYQFEAWAKATNKTKLVLWIVQPGADPKAKAGLGRQSVAAWEGLPNQWKKCTAEVPVRGEGMLEMQIVAPSSHAAPPGRIWVDDIAFYETEQAIPTLVSESGVFSDEATMAQANDGSLYLAWDSFRDAADTLQVARYGLSGKEFKKLGQWQPLGGKGTYILGVKTVAAGDKVFVLYAAEVDKNWDIYALPCSASGPGKPVRVTTSEAVDVKPSGAWRDGTLWVGWESSVGGWRQILAASVRDGVVSKPEQVSVGEASNYDPSVTALAGEVFVAWHSFRQNNFDIYLRRRAGGKWDAERRLTQAPSIDRHPLLTTRGADVWLIYENALMGVRPGDEGINEKRSYAVGATTMRRLIVAKVGSEGLLAPKGYAASSPVYRQKSEAPAALFDPSGRLWLACRTVTPPAGPKSKSRAWNVSLTSFDGRTWSQPMVVSHSWGIDRCPSLALAGDRLILAYQAETGPIVFDDEEKSKSAVSEIFLASLTYKPADGPVPTMELEPLVEPKEQFAPGTIRVARGEDRPTPSITYQGQKLNLYFGNLHDHTDISQCNRVGDESVDESYAHMRDINRYDFACATDHGHNINPYLWGYTAKSARVNEDRPRFLTFLAEEWTSTFEEYSEKHPYGFYGHRNLIFADPYLPRWWNARSRQTPAQVWEDLRKMKANFVQIPHQLADTGNVPTDWDFTDEVAQPVAEIFQVRGSYEHKGTPREAGNTTPGGRYFLQDAWARGIVIGVIAAPDHGGSYGKACVYAPSLTREAILDALRARRCYGTTAAKMFLDVRVDGHFMGEKVAKPAGNTVNVEVRADCPADIDRIEVCRNNDFIYAKPGEGSQSQFTFTDQQPLPGRSYYYVRVLQKDGEIAWSSPVWFGAN